MAQKAQPEDRNVPVGHVLVYGKFVDSQTRCEHYHSALDILAIKFPCCDRYYPCHACHEECARHSAQKWPKSRWKEKAILCGVCGSEFTIEEYLRNPSRCTNCKSDFNPRCVLHHPLYFEL